MDDRLTGWNRIAWWAWIGACIDFMLGIFDLAKQSFRVSTCVAQTVPAQETAPQAVELTREQKEPLPRNAEVVRFRWAGQGVTRSRRATLTVTRRIRRASYLTLRKGREL